MLNNAIKKIQDEIDSDKNNSYVQYVGKHMIEHINKNPGYAQNILEEGKTIKGSLEEMRKEAAKIKQDNVALIDQAKGMKIIFNYFGIKEMVEEEVEDIRPKRNVNISLDDLL